MIFLDTNVLVYASGLHGPGDPRTGVAQRLVTQLEAYAVSVQVLSEFFDRTTRGSRALSRERAIAYLSEWRRFTVQPQTLELLDSALDIAERYRFRYWDCAIIAAARLTGATTLLSEDMQHGQVVEGIRILNPFIDAN